MFTLRSLVFGALTVVTLGSQAQEVKAQLIFNDVCKNFTVEYFGQAYHPGDKNRLRVRQGTLNEINTGTGLECVLNKNFYVHAAELLNSHWGHTTVVSLGGKVSTPAYKGFSVSARLEAAYINYPIPLKRSVVRGVTPLPSLQFNYTLSSGGTIGVNHYFLGDGGVSLTSVFWKKQF